MLSDTRSICTLRVEPYEPQKKRWPSSGQPILAQFDDEGITVYQAFRPDIADYAVTNGCFGGPFSLTRMSWIKTNFLWMMFRSGWASKLNQERILAVTIQRNGFESLLTQAVPSSYEERQYPSRKDWQMAVNHSDVRLQWDPDHSPSGGKVARRAIQLGLRGEPLRWYAQEGILKIEDVTAFVREQRQNVVSMRYDLLMTPSEACYPVPESIRVKLGMAVNDA